MPSEVYRFFSQMHAHIHRYIYIYIYLLYTYRGLRAKEHRNKNSLFALEKPADWTYDFFHQ